MDEFRYDYPDACRMIGVEGEIREYPQLPAAHVRRAALRRAARAIFWRARRKSRATIIATNTSATSKTSSSGRTPSRRSRSRSGLIIIIQMITSMIYSTSSTTIATLVAAGALMAGFGAWIIFRSAPRESHERVAGAKARPEQRRALRLFKILLPIAILVAAAAAW